MRARSVLVPLAAAASLATLALRRRRSPRRRVDLYFADGSTLSLSEGSADGDRLVGLAAEALSAARRT